MSSLNLENIHVIEHDQAAIIAAYQVADAALSDRNHRDQNRELPFDIIDLFSQKGLGGIRVPKEYGGAYVSNKTLTQVFRILSKADASVGQIPQNQFGLLNLYLYIATPEQKKFIFSEILNGKRIANGGPEKNSKNSSTIHTKLSIENNQYLLNGEKFYSTGTIFADWISLRALHPDGHTIIALVKKDAEGLKVVNDWDGFGQRTTASGTVILNNVAVDPFLILDESKLEHSINFRGAYSQLIQVAIDVGIAEAAYEDTISTIKKARPIIDAQVEKASQEHYTLQEVGKLKILLDAAILLLDEAAEALDELEQVEKLTEAQTQEAAIRVAEAKIYANDAALQISEKLLELGGSRASLQEANLDQHWRNARVHTLHDPVRWKLHAVGNYYLNHQFPANHAWI
ncbi:SfnB family sulfur acquisition oxidoreductase [Acinetobacter gerneri]|uniref:SfnB family sulfur acquisition oxidoreductase n=1 Tax=Acinetobacter gerneri TaxID=202952 RepID=UPI002936479C|nr:SfnB family sulfur acquisition oxidoreductase [Acinetobacter gerneri]MDV2440116.1 SfnB family sulfur acquisition oxidoreductase [Acinetobacter gerneri]